MRILLTTPLYPPDIADLAPYVKELATRLSPHHTVEILTYGHIPEAIPGVRIITIEKSSILPIRIFRFTRTLWQMSKQSEYIYSQNGPSVEVPILILSLFSSKPTLMRLGDQQSLQKSLSHPLLKKLLCLTMQSVYSVITHTELPKDVANCIKNQHYIERPLSRPEILPFTEFPTRDFALFEESWGKHVATLLSIFKI